MYSGHKLHVVGSNNTEYTYPIFDDRNDIPTGMTSFQYQIDDNKTGYIRALPQSLYPETGLHIMDSTNRIITAVKGNSNRCILQWHWRTQSEPYSTLKFICPDSATLDFGIHTDLEVVVYWHETNVGWHSATVGTIPAGATSITMSGEYGGTIVAQTGNLITAWYFLIRTKVAYRTISGSCVYTMVSATITANVSLSEPLPAGHIVLRADWYGLNIPFHAEFGDYAVLGPGQQSGSSFVSFDAMVALAPTNYWTYLRYYPDTTGAYGSTDMVGRGWAPAGGGQFTDGFTIDVPTGASADVDRTSEYGIGSSTTQAGLFIPEVYW